MSALEFFRRGRSEDDFAHVSGYRIARTRPRIVCADGYSLSVQAGALLYSTPRDDCGPWSHVEVGFPDACPEPWETWRQYADEEERPTRTVYANVPLELVEALVALHGGERR